MDIEPIVALLEERFRAWLTGPRVSRGAGDEALDALLDATSARATGLWRCEPESVRLVGFRAVTDMPREVSEGFAAAMATAPLSATDLACVAAVVEGRTRAGTLDPQRSGLPGSASWLERFEAVQSLAVPVARDGASVGVLAISTVALIEEGDAVWETMHRLVARLAPYL